jgi:hypothetical protein
MRTFTCRSTFLYAAGAQIPPSTAATVLYFSPILNTCPLTMLSCLSVFFLSEYRGRRIVEGVRVEPSPYHATAKNVVLLFILVPCCACTCRFQITWLPGWPFLFPTLTSLDPSPWFCLLPHKLFLTSFLPPHPQMRSGFCVGILTSGLVLITFLGFSHRLKEKRRGEIDHPCEILAGGRRLMEYKLPQRECTTLFGTVLYFDHYDTHSPKLNFGYQTKEAPTPFTDKQSPSP